MDFNSVLIPEFVILAVFLYGLGMAMKTVPRFPNWLIPIVLAVVGIGLGAVYGPMALSGYPWPYYVMMGGIAAWAAVWGNQVVKQCGRR